MPSFFCAFVDEDEVRPEGEGPAPAIVAAIDAEDDDVEARPAATSQDARGDGGDGPPGIVPIDADSSSDDEKQKDEYIQPPLYMEVDRRDDKLDANGGLWIIRIIVTIPRGLGFVLKPKQFSWYIKEEDHEADLEVSQCHIRYDNQQGALVPFVNQRSLEMVIEELLRLLT